MKTHATILSLCALTAATAVRAQDAEKITYQDHIRPLLENKCFSCHNPDKKKGDLDLTSFAALMTGGGGGSIVDAGNSDGSRIWSCCAKKEEPFMPPEGAPLGPKDLDLIAKWIMGGVLDTKSSLAKKSNKPKVNMSVVVTSGRPEGPIAKPEHILLEPVLVTPRTTAVTAMAASPWTSLVAMAGQKQILLYDTDTRQLAGILPYTEGFARSLRFSRNGSLLVMGGGKGGKFGHAVVWDVKTGKRIVEVGKEFDQVMSADISPDQKMVVIGSPSKKVKVYDTATGEEMYTISKHTDWVMDTSFSPDGVLLATADRGGNVMVWEASNGGEFYILGQHKGSCTDMAWRADSNILASCSADGTIMLWEMNEGKQVKTWAAHGGGVQSVSFTPDGKLVSSGNDGMVRLWDVNGKQLAVAPSQGDIVTKVVALYDSKSVVSANWRGEVKMLALTDKITEVGALSSNPPLIAQRIIESEQRTAELNGKIGPAQAVIQKAEANAKALDEALAKTRAEAAATEARSKALPGEIAATEKAINEVKAKREQIKKDREVRVAALAKYAADAASVQKLEKEAGAIALEAGKLPGAESAVQNLQSTLDAKKKDLAGNATDAALQAKVKELEDKLTAANAEVQKFTAAKQKATGLAADIAKAKQALGAAPAPLADLDKALADADATLKTHADAVAAKRAETPKVAAALKDLPARVKAAETAAVKGKEALATAQGNAKAMTEEIAILQRAIPALKAAQFNVGVLTEKEKLAKLEGDVNDFTSGKKENEEAKVADAARIESSKKAIAEAVAAVPVRQATLNKLSAELAALEQAVLPTRAADTAVAAKLDEQRKMLAAREAELAALAKVRDDGIEAAKKSLADIGKAIDPLKKKLAELAPKLEGPEKALQAKKDDLAAKETALATLKKNAADTTATMPAAEKAAKESEAAVSNATGDIQAADQALAKAGAAVAEATKAVPEARRVLAKAEKDIADAKADSRATVAQEQALADAKAKLAEAEKKVAESAAKMTAAQAALDTSKAARAATEKSLAEARKAAGKLKYDLTNTTNAITQAEKKLAQAKAQVTAAEKVAAPLLGQKESISKEIAAQRKARADKQALPAALEAEYAAKAQPVNAAIAQIKAAIVPLEKAFTEARGKLEAELKVVDAKKAEVTKATESLAAAKKQKTDAEAAIVAANKDIPQREKNIAEITAELAKLQPQVEPLRAKVKQLEAQYFTMLPK